MAALTVVDANVLIAHLDPGDVLHEQVEPALDAVLAAEGLPAASTLTIAEALVRPARAGREDDVLAAFDAIGLVTIDLDEASAVLLARLRARTGLRMPDCCVLHAARTLDAPLLSFDERVRRVAAQVGVALADDA